VNIIFRVDAYHSIGSGHLIRCLNLADELNDFNNIWFITIASDYFVELINQRGYKALVIDRSSQKKEYKRIDYNQDASRTIQIIKEHRINVDTLIVDNYALDNKWEKQLRSVTKKIVVIDDLANRKHLCDLLLDQNLVKNMDTRYKHLIKKNTELLLGPKYVILGKEYSLQRKNISIRSNDIKRVLISFGGVDEFNFTGKLVEYLSGIKFKDIQFEVAVTDSFIFLEDLLTRSNQKNIKIHRNIDSLASLMRKCDIAIGAGGTTTWERLSLALPSIVITIADNQLESAKLLSKMELINWIGHHSSLKNHWLSDVGELLISNKRNSKMSKESFSIVSGLGSKEVAKRIVMLTN
jgi:UDP-2,4-diacetamido-2,4,6-trideoxy-beta-L-altropyranose hydrolase